VNGSGGAISESKAAGLRLSLAHGPWLQVTALIGVYTACSASIPGFNSRSSLYSILVLAAFLGLAAVGQTLVILIGGIDLSVPGIIGAANLATAGLSGHGWPFVLVVLTVLLAAALLGGVAGWLTREFRVPAMIVTLATGAIAAGALLGTTDGGQVTGQVPAWLSTFSSPIGHVGGIPIPPVIVLWACVSFVFIAGLRVTVFGRHLYATGANERAATLALVRTRRIWIASFAISAIFSALVGILLTGFSGTGNPDVGSTYLFTGLAAVLVGGTSLVGARGDYSRTIIGALTMTLLTTFLLGRGYGPATQQILIGLLILAVVALYGRERRIRDEI